MDLNSDDLQAYLIILWRWKWLIGVCAVLAVAVAVVVVYITPPQYESSVLVVLTKPIYDLEFDPRILSQDSAPWPSRWYSVGPTYQLLAKDPSLVQGVVDALGESLAAGDRSVNALDNHLDVREVSVEGIVQLVVSHPDPEAARLIADTWARLYVERLNQLYGQTTQDLAVMDTQLETARQDLDAAQTELAQFLQRSRLPALEKQLLVRQSTLMTCFGVQDRLDLVVEDAQALRTRVQKGTIPGLEYATQLAIIYLELRSLGAQDIPAYVLPSEQQGVTTGESSITLQIMVDSTTLATAGAADQVRYLDELIAATQAKKAALGTRTTQLEREIASLQSEIATESATQNRLTLTCDVAFGAFSSLATKSKEIKVSVELDSELARVAGPAIQPKNPVPSSSLLKVGLAAVGGLLLGVCGALAIEFVRSWPDEPTSRQPDELKT